MRMDKVRKVTTWPCGAISGTLVVLGGLGPAKTTLAVSTPLLSPKLPPLPPSLRLSSLLSSLQHATILEG